jgi:hypothetical protein
LMLQLLIAAAGDITTVRMTANTQTHSEQASLPLTAAATA